MAVQAYEEALKLDPNNAKTYYNLALALDKVGDLKRASALEKSIQLDPKLALTQNQLGSENRWKYLPS